MSLAPLYLRALLGKRRGRPEQALSELSAPATVDAARLDRYRETCGFGTGGGVPATFPHLLAFPLTLRLMTSPGFPAPVLGMVHLRNSISQYRPVEPGEPLTLRAWLGETGDHARGTSYELLAEATAGDTPVWYEQSVYLHRHKKSERRSDAGEKSGARDRKPATGRQHEEPGEVWPVPAGTGRRYAAVSGDRNPIHLSALTARLFGFRTAIAHGMWAKARCLAALEGGDGLPDRFRIEVAFRRPVPVPGTVAFHQYGSVFTLTGRDGNPTHLTGVLEPAT